MVEEANAASATLAQEAGRLRELIGRFTLAGTTDNGHGWTQGRTSGPRLAA
jgi:methyl-accepting chemotaxis protein